MNRNSRQRRQRRRQPNMDVVEMQVHNPPPYSPTTVVSRVFRFSILSASGGTFTLTPCKLCAVQGIGTGVNSVIQLYESVRVRYVEIWASPPQNGSVVSCTVSYPGSALGISGPNYTKSDYSMGMTKSAHVKLRPSKTSQASQWQSGSTSLGTNTLFQITLSNPSGTANQAYVVDVALTLRMTTDARTTNNSVTTVSAGTAGGFYNLALDNPAGGTGSVGNLLVPDAVLPTIT